MFEFNFFPLVWSLCSLPSGDRFYDAQHEEDFSLLAMNTEAIRQRHVTFASLKSSQGQQGVAGQTFPSPCGAASQSLCRLSADSCTGESSANGRATRAASQQRMSAMARLPSLPSVPERKAKAVAVVTFALAADMTTVTAFGELQFSQAKRDKSD